MPRHGAASSSIMTINVDDDEPIPAPWPQQQVNIRIGALPSDLLIPILSLAISVESEFSPAYDVRALLLVSAVCRHWRWAALNSSSLWAYIPSYLPQGLVQLFLRRSVEALLHVDLEYGDRAEDLRGREGKFASKLASLFHHANRIRYLSLRLSASALKSYDICRVLVGGRTLVLEGLRLHNSTDYSRTSPKEKIISDTEVYAFKKFRSPVLRELHLKGVTVPHDCIPNGSLSSLSLQVAGFDFAAKEYLINVLKAGSSLVSLSLDMWPAIVRLGHNEWASTAANPTPFPELRQLTLKGPSDQCLLAYRMLSAPSLEEIRLETKNSKFEDAPQFIPPKPPGDLVRIFVDDRTVRIEFTESGRSGRGVNRHFLFTLSTPNRIGFRKIKQLFPTLLGSHHFVEIAYMDISISRPFDHAFMPSLLPHFGTLRSLRMSVAGWLQEVFSIENAFSLSLLRSPSLPLRSLQNLVFRNFPVTMPQAGPFLVELSAIIRGKAREDLPPLVLEFENCKGVTDALLGACGFDSSYSVNQ